MSSRKHIFRAKAVGDGEWVYGDLIHYNHPNREKVCIRSEEWPQIESDVEEDTVGEFTGLLDKNGKAAYEDDIVRLEYRNLTAVVKFNTKYGYFSPIDVFDGWSFVIVGNIHDNKDLVNK